MVICTYGVIDSEDTIGETIFGLDPSLKGIGRSILVGLEGAGVYNISYRDIGVAVSELREKIQEITDADVLKHEEVIETLMTKFTVLPIRFSTIFNTKEELLSMVEFYYQDFKDNLARFRNKVEFGIKVIWPQDTIKQRITAALDKAKRNVVISTDSPAKSFVKEKYEKHIIEKEFEEEANRCIAVVDDYFNKIATEKRLKKLQTDNLLLNAAYLVEKDKQNDFKKAFEQLKNAPGDLKFLFSGPWPCYNFITLTKKSASVDYFNTKDMLNRLLAQQGLAQERNSA